MNFYFDGEQPTERESQNNHSHMGLRFRPTTRLDLSFFESEKRGKVKVQCRAESLRKREATKEPNPSEAIYRGYLWGPPRVYGATLFLSRCEAAPLTILSQFFCRNLVRWNQIVVRLFYNPNFSLFVRQFEHHYKVVG